MAQSSDRPASPFLELKPTARSGVNEIEYYQVIQSREKIHRIRTKSKFVAEITYVTSPSEIWVRPTNNIAQKLTIPFNEAPNLEKDLKENVYVMTPLDEDILVRARIILFDESKGRYLLRLIDHGKPVWRNAEDIFEMKSETDDMRRYPWQAIPIILQGVNPENGKEWTEVEVLSMYTASIEFPACFVIPTLHEHLVVNDDTFYTRATINCLDENDLEAFRKMKYKNRDLFVKHGFSLAELYRMILPSDIPRTLSSQAEPKMTFLEQEPFPYPNQYDDEIEYQAFNDTTDSKTPNQKTPDSQPSPSFEIVDFHNISGINAKRSSKNDEDFIKFD